MTSNSTIRQRLVDADATMASVDTTRGGIKRVAIIISQLRPGGAERVVAHLATGLRSEGVEPLVICIQEKGELAAELETLGVSVVSIGSLKSRDWAGLLRLAKVLARFQPSVINVHDCWSLPYVAVASLVVPTCPVVLTGHGELYEGFEPLQRRLRFCSRRLSAIATVSEEVRGRHVSYFNWRGRTHVVPNGVPDICRNRKDREELRAELGISKDNFLFLAVGNACREKAFEDLISASVEIGRRQPDTSFSVLIAGRLSDNEYGRALRRQAEASSVQGLQLLGYRGDIDRLYSAADVLVVSSRSEGLPMVVLEAMTAGLPIIGTRVGGIPHAVPEGCGLLVEPNQPSSLAAAMLELLTTGRNRCENMGRASREWAIQQFGVSRMVKNYLDVYANEIRRKTKRASS